MRPRRALTLARRLAALVSGVTRQHYLSFLSAVVIGIIFALAMTSSGFENPALPKIALHGDAVGEAAGDVGHADPAPPAQGVTVAAPRASFWLTYYIVEDQEQKDAILDLIAHDSFTRFQTSGLLPSEGVFFIDASQGDAFEQIAWLQHDGALLEAGTEGLSLRIVDLRRETH